MPTLRRAGAHIADPVELTDANKISEPEFAALTLEFKHDLNAYLAGLGGEHPAELAGLIEFNSRERGYGAGALWPGIVHRGGRDQW